MAAIRHCPNPNCPHYLKPVPGWWAPHGSYITIAHGRVRRVRCRACRATVSRQTFDIHYFAKRRLDLREIFVRQRGGSSLRDIGRELNVSRNAVQSASFRLGRQAMAGHTLLIKDWANSRHCAYDGLQSFVVSQDTPCHISHAVDSESNVVLAMTHTVLRRGGTMREDQKERRTQREKVWRPRSSALKEDISLLVSEIPRLMAISGDPAQRAVINTDRLPVYRTVMESDVGMRWMLDHKLIEHHCTDSRKPRTYRNPLFPVNYIDMLVRHRLKEHTRETIAFGRHAVHQMHRMWIMVYDHNVRQPHRVKRQNDGRTHATVAQFNGQTVEQVQREFLSERLDLRGAQMPVSIERVWRGELESPPVRWKSGQTQARPAPIPGYALRDLWRLAARMPDR